MVKYNPKTWLDLIFHTYSRQIIKVLFPALLFMLIYTAGACYLILDYFEFEYKSSTAFHSLLGIVLGLILVFRMNSAYDRWWEGRQLWGSLVNNTRNLAFKLNAIIKSEDKENRDFFRRWIANVPFSIKEHLRDNVNYDELDIKEGELLKKIENSDHKVNAILAILYKRVEGLFQKGIITGDQYIILDKEMKSFADILGACERIKNTPIPYSYSMYVKKFIFTFTITLPFGFVTAFEYLTIPVVLLLFFTMVVIELISEEIEDPFGTDANDLPTDSLSEKIRNNVNEIFQD